MDSRESAKRYVSHHREFRRRSDIERAATFTDEVLSEVELRIAIEATGLGIFDYSPLTDEMHWTHLAKEHCGLSPDAYVNYNVFMVALHPEDRGRVTGHLQNAMRRENDGKYNTEYRTIGIEDGKERWIAARGRAFFNHKGEAVRLIGTTQEITEHMRADDQLKRALRELERANKELRQIAKKPRDTP